MSHRATGQGVGLKRDWPPQEFHSSSGACQAKVSLPLRAIQQEVSRLGTQVSYDLPLVDPFEFPLVYDESSMLVDGGRVHLDDLWRSTGRVATELPAQPGEYERAWSRKTSRNSPRFHQHPAPVRCWSTRFQWLPCEVELTPSTDTDEDIPDVCITSYINNLHPYAHQTLYKQFELLVSRSINSWNEVLFYRDTRGIHPPRILTYGCPIENRLEKPPVSMKISVVIMNVHG